MDGELAYWAGLSGLTPASAFSVADHMTAAGQDVPVPRSYFAGLSGLTPADQFSYAEHKRAVYAGGGGGDVTPPTAGTLASSNITDTTFDLTVSGASDAVGLHAQPYRFSTDNGSTWSAYQTSPVFNVTGKTASTAYTCVHQTRDAALNVSTGSSIVVNTNAAVTYADLVLAAGPAIYAKLNEASAALTAADSSGNSRTMDYGGTRASIAGLVSGSADTAISFTDGYASRPREAWMDDTTFTAEAIIKQTASSSYRAIITCDGIPGSRFWNFYVKDGKLLLFQADDGAEILLGATTLTLNTAYHVALTADGTNVRLFVNGVQDAILAKTLAAPAGVDRALVIGASVAGNASVGARLLPFAGVIDEAVVYPTALSAPTLLAHAQKAGLA